MLCLLYVDAPSLKKYIVFFVNCIHWEEGYYKISTVSLLNYPFYYRCIIHSIRVEENHIVMMNILELRNKKLTTSSENLNAFLVSQRSAYLKYSSVVINCVYQQIGFAE